jgi:hypothetical protein
MMVQRTVINTTGLLCIVLLVLEQAQAIAKNAVFLSINNQWGFSYSPTCKNPPG